MKSKMSVPRVVYTVVSALLVAAGLYTFFLSGSDRYLLGLVSFLFLLVPAIAEKIFKSPIGYGMKSCIIGFCTLAFTLGMGLRWYDKYDFYDIFAHTLSGILFTMLGIYIFRSLDHGEVTGRRHVVLITYAVFFSAFVAVTWEIFEFGSYLITGHDSQHHLTTGVFDTMEDLISCFIGSLLMVVDYVVYCRWKKSLFTPLALKQKE